MNYLLWQHENSKRKLCICLFKSENKLAQTLLKDQKDIQLVGAFPKQVSKNKRVWNGFEVMLE